MYFILNKIEILDWLLLQPLNIPKQVDASNCGIHAILNIMVFVATRYNQVVNFEDISNLVLVFLLLT